jgi:cytoskeletal protein RodZ
MDDWTKEQIVNSLQEISQLPIENRKLHFSKCFSAACRVANTTPSEIAHLTRINIEFVKGLAEGDFASLPSEVFVRGFLKSIAKMFDVPPEVLVNAYSRTLRNDPATAQKRETVEQNSKKVVASVKKEKTSSIEKNALESNSSTTSSKTNWSFDEADLSVGKSEQTKTFSKQPEFSDDPLLGTLKEFGNNPTQKTSTQGSAFEVNPKEANAKSEFTGGRPEAGRGKGSSDLGNSPELAASAKNSVGDTSRSTVSMSNPSHKKTWSSKNLESNRRSSWFSLSFVPAKVWAMLVGFLVIGAAVLWPNERSPNGTVIEEAKVTTTDLNVGLEATSGDSPTSSDQSVAAGSSALQAEVTEPLKTAVPVILDPQLEKGNLTVPEGEQVVEINANEEVKVRVFIDGKVTDFNHLNVAKHSFSFENFAEFFIYDASAVDVTFNGRDLGQLGGKGKVRRLSFAKRLKENKNIN